MEREGFMDMISGRRPSQRNNICRQGSTCCSKSLTSTYKLPETTLYHRYVGTPSCISKYKTIYSSYFFPCQQWATADLIETTMVYKCAGARTIPMLPYLTCIIKHTAWLQCRIFIYWSFQGGGNSYTLAFASLRQLEIFCPSFLIFAV